MSNKAKALLSPLPDSPAGRQLAWWLTLLVDAGEGASLADLDRYAPAMLARLGPAQTVETLRATARANAERFGEIAGVAVEAADQAELTVLMTMANGRRWAVTLAVEPAAPHRITRLDVERRFDFQLDVREATAADAETLADIERRCPIVLGDTSVHFDRGADYLASTRLMQECTIGIASVDGVPAAVSCGAEHTVRIGGALRQMVTVSHLRVLPEHQRKGLWGAANRALRKYWERADPVAGSNAYISVDNAGMQHGFANTPNKWGQIVQRAQLDCAALAGPMVGRPARLAAADAIVTRLNASHDAEEMFVPYTAESFAARMARAPDLYAWERVWMTDGALVGVWPAGDALRVVTETRGVRTVSVRAVVLDYAFEPGAEDQFEGLLRAWCGWLAPRGIDTLSIFTSPASPGAALLTALTRETEGFFMWTPGIEVPEGADTRGLYVDAVYF